MSDSVFFRFALSPAFPSASSLIFIKVLGNIRSGLEK